MQDSSDSNDVLPKAITYFYPPDEQIKNDKLLDCGEIVGVVQYFQHDLFRSMIRTLNFQKLHVVHQHYGRHSGFLCVPDERYTPEEAHVYLKHILDLFNLLYGTWNHIQLTYQGNETVTAFFNEALTPIINYVLNQHRSITNLFSIIEYTPLKSGNQRVLLDAKHYLGHLKSKYGLVDGFIGYDDKVLYSTCDSDTTYCLQILCQSKNEISENLISMPWESEFRLRNGVSLYRIFVRQPIVPSPPRKNLATTYMNISTNPTPVPGTPVTAIPTAAIPIFRITADLKYMSDDSPPSSQANPHRLTVPPSYADDRRSGKLMLTDPSGSSEETGFDTDTADEASSLPPDVMSTSSLSLGELSSNELQTEDSDSSSPTATTDERPITDDDKIQDPNPSRSSTVSEESPLEKTIQIDRKDSTDELGTRFHWEEVDSFDTSDDEEAFQISNRGLFATRERTRTVTSETSSDGGDYLRNEAQVSWKNIPEKNTEHERNQHVLYIQRNSRMIFVGIIEESLLSDEYLNKLWNLMISQLAHIDSQIQVIPTANELIKLTPDVRFEYNENTRLADFRRNLEGMRYVRRIPTEDSTYMAFFARNELNRNSQRKVIGISRGNQYVSIDRRLPDRIIYSCQRFQESQ